MDFENITDILSEIYTNLDEEYKIVLKKCETAILNASTVLEKEEIFDLFSNKYLILPTLWELIIYNYLETDEVKSCKYLHQSISHFYCQQNTNYLQYYMRYLGKSEYYPWKNKIPFSKSFYEPQKYNIFSAHLLTFPHSELENERKRFDEYSYFPVPKGTLEKYEKAKMIKEKLSTENLSHEEWIEYLFEWDDKNFVIQSIESRLALNCCDKNLWKAYIKAMKHRNRKIMLNVIQRYTKLFLSDHEMKQKYEIEAQNVENESDNLCEWQNFLFDDVPPAIETLNSELFNARSNVKQQYFSLPKNLIFLILSSSNADLRFKLFKTCKVLFLQKSTPICHHLEIHKIGANFESSTYCLQSLKLLNTNVEHNLKPFTKLYISNRIHVQNCNVFLLHKLIPKMYKCDTRFISLTHQILTIKEFNFLVNPKKVEKIFIWSGGIVEDNGNAVDLKKILQRLPNAYSIQVCFNAKFILSPCVDLFLLERNAKLETLFLKYFDKPFILEDYCNFVLKNAASDATFGMGFSPDVSEEEITEFDKAVNEFTLLHFDKKIQRNSHIGFDRMFEVENLENAV